jgi:type 1 glutamine amidotransferase
MLKALLIVEGEADWWSFGLRDILEENRLFDVTITNEAKELLADSTVAFDYDLFVVGYRSALPAGDARDNFVGSLADGAGLVIVPATSASVSTANTEPFAAIEALTAPANSTWTLPVHYVDHHHPVTRALRDFDVPSTLAGSQLHGDIEVFVLATSTAVASEKAIPVIAVCKHERGRIYQSAFGDSSVAAALENEGFRRSIARGAEWASTGNVLDF